MLTEATLSADVSQLEIGLRVIFALTFILSLIGNFVMLMSGPSCECSKCHGLYQESFMIKLITSTNPNHVGRLICKTCWRETLWPGGKKGWYQRFLERNKK